MKAFVENLLREKLSPLYYYHNVAHTLYVMDKAAEIGRHEHCSEKEIELMIAAALWHDSGYINTNTSHEKESCVLARQYLPAYGFSAAETDAICGMIMATRMPQSPKNKLEEIIADADLEYLGTAAAAEKANDLFRELKELNPAFTNEQWQKTQLNFLSAHQYFTRYCKENKEPLKQAYLQRLLQDKG